jgi:hypothetical protein
VAAVPHARPGIGAVWDRVAGRAAELAGHVVGRVLRAAPTVPGLAGAAMVAYGAAMVYAPAGVIAGGVFLLALDRRL